MSKSNKPIPKEKINIVLPTSGYEKLGRTIPKPTSNIQPPSKPKK